MQVNTHPAPTTTTRTRDLVSEFLEPIFNVLGTFRDQEGQKSKGMHQYLSCYFLLRAWRGENCKLGGQSLRLHP